MKKKATGRMGNHSIEGSISAILMMLLLVTVAVQVIGRSAGGFGPVWTEELSRWLWIWMSFVGLAEVERQRGNLRMDAFQALFPASVSRGINLLIDIAFCLVLVHLIQIGISMVVRTANYSSVALPIPTAWLYAAFPVGGALTFVRVVMRVIGEFAELRSSFARNSAGDEK
ncbi:TRAP-type C4-dicarboxylate transport system, small permease component [Cohaesibacter sp. ES.047]|uniref:TRAP transporter small permease n=1 Tax=Cohaesibacter sp. ES.047 TaxID=1798205 RepID=UPI000BB6C185|nr:TRAP transporter small permease [Cohaesibacter sp. ES.047]SNY90253.1 TRAP-type C4-dicarboxylate transport system, small permease component [Cohaesibacter sp. ES.047]